MGSVLEYDDGTGRALRVYITGDTLCRTGLREVPERCGPIDVMVTHLGGTRALGILVTMDARQGADLVEMIKPPMTVPIHYDDYTVFRSPLEDFEAMWKERELPGELCAVRRGETLVLR
jgi:L-ascorbate metabolism protein UlaG (beta-lactamase superfamily)